MQSKFNRLYNRLLISQQAQVNQSQRILEDLEAVRPNLKNAAGFFLYLGINGHADKSQQLLDILKRSDDPNDDNLQRFQKILNFLDSVQWCISFRDFDSLSEIFWMISTNADRPTFVSEREWRVSIDKLRFLAQKDIISKTDSRTANQIISNLLFAADKGLPGQYDEKDATSMFTYYYRYNKTFFDSFVDNVADVNSPNYDMLVDQTVRYVGSQSWNMQASKKKFNDEKLIDFVVRVAREGDITLKRKVARYCQLAIIPELADLLLGTGDKEVYEKVAMYNSSLTFDQCMMIYRKSRAFLVHLLEHRLPQQFLRFIIDSGEARKVPIARKIAINMELYPDLWTQDLKSRINGQCAAAPAREALAQIADPSSYQQFIHDPDLSVRKAFKRAHPQIEVDVTQPRDQNNPRTKREVILNWIQQKGGATRKQITQYYFEQFKDIPFDPSVHAGYLSASFQEGGWLRSPSKNDSRYIIRNPVTKLWQVVSQFN